MLKEAAKASFFYCVWFGIKIAAISSRKLGDGSEGQLKNQYLYNDKELWEDGDINWYDYGFRNYDPQIGRFPQLDPLTWDYHFLTPYQYASCDPINNIDLDGLEGLKVTDGFVESSIGKAAVTGASKLPEVFVTQKPNILKNIFSSSAKASSLTENLSKIIANPHTQGTAHQTPTHREESSINRNLQATEIANDIAQRDPALPTHGSFRAIDPIEEYFKNNPDDVGASWAYTAGQNARSLKYNLRQENYGEAFLNGGNLALNPPPFLGGPSSGTTVFGVRNIRVTPYKTVADFNLNSYKSFEGGKSSHVGAWLQANGWNGRPTNSNRVYNNGMRYTNGVKGEQIRIMPGGPGRSIPAKTGPYMEISIGGQKTVIELFTNPNLQ